VKSQRKDEGVSLQHLTNREKTLLVDALRQTYTVAELLIEVGLPRSSYFYHRARLDIVDKYVEVRHTVTEIFERNQRCYGYRRMQASLNKQSITVSEKGVRRLMKQERLAAYFGDRDRPFRPS
jgi:putative transposase